MSVPSKNQVKAGNRFGAYVKGWQKATVGGAPDTFLLGHSDKTIAEAYDEGYQAGSKARASMLDGAASHFGYDYAGGFLRGAS